MKIVTVRPPPRTTSTRTSLTTKMRTAIAEYSAGDLAGACSTLRALINEAQAQSGKRLTAAQANAVIDAATRIRAVIGC